MIYIVACYYYFDVMYNCHKYHGTYLQSISVFEAIRYNLSLGHLVEPIKFPAAVLATVESCEPLKTSFQLKRTEFVNWKYFQTR